MRALHVLVLGSAMLAASAAPAGVIFDNGGPLTGAASDVGSDLSFNLQVADDFTLAAGAGPITGIRWFGVYDTAGAPPSKRRMVATIVRSWTSRSGTSGACGSPVCSRDSRPKR